MARALSGSQAGELADFVRGLFVLGGFATWAEFAAAAGMHPTNVSNVQNGKSGIDGYNLFKLIRAAAERAELTPAETARAVAPNDRLRLAKLSEKVDALAGAMDDVRGILVEQRDQPRARGSRRQSNSGDE